MHDEAGTDPVVTPSVHPNAGEELASDPPTRSRGIRIYPASDAVDNSSTGFRGETRASPETQQQLVDLRAQGFSSGIQSKMLFRQSADEGGFSALLVWGKPNYSLPRHSHMSDCMYFVISGSASMGNTTLGPGDSFFVPQGAPYQYTAGPEGVEVLEVRRDVDTIGIELSDISAATFERQQALTSANRDRWAEMDVSPTFASNQRSAGAGT